VVAVVGEIAEAGKEVEGVVEVVDVKGEAHILDKKLQSICFVCFCGFDIFDGDVNACNVVAMFCELLCKAAFAAGNIEHGAAGQGLQITEQVFYKFLRFKLIPVLIEYFIKGGTEPFFVPIHFFSRKS